MAHERSFSELATDLASNTVARYNFIGPNLCNDMHDVCPPQNDQIRQGDDFLAATMPMILDSRAYRDGGAVFLTWDEGTADTDGPLGMIVLSSLAKGNGYSNAVYYTHSSTLRTLQEIFGVAPFLGDAENASDLSDLFTPTAFLPGQIGVSPLSQTIYAFAIGDTVQAAFIVTNTGSLTLNGSATVDPPFAIVSGSPFSLAAGDSTNLVVSYTAFNPATLTNRVIFTCNHQGVTNQVIGCIAVPPRAI